ncbi:hypothetical protein D0863_14739 [Hortaea werneckii]|uniref:Glycosyltransferase family 69 protein n=1 Tax=Hortaea werneckii TaxID=91943 RepID=A0A3M7CFY9_HORWE|nr:hypothetical protein D0863_14739 [Hortaea werneckii]
MRICKRRSIYLSRPLRVILLGIVVWTIIEAAYVRSALTRQLAPWSKSLNSGRVYIASIHWNNEANLRSSWIPAVLDLVKELGTQEVYISIQESGSWDRSKDALKGLDNELDRLGVRRRIILDPTTHFDEISKPPAERGWVSTPRDRLELRRIPYLARLRNLVMEPLFELRQSGVVFDKVIFLNDVVFTTQDVQKLIGTRNGDYAAACSIDFSKPPRFYDTFALRDSEGHDALQQTWPFFRARSSRKALLANDAVPVSSCWNGMVVMDALAFYAHNLTFRGVPDSLASEHVEGSECCLIHADNPFSRTKGVWVNPHVRVGYSGPAYESVNPNGPWLSLWAIVRGIWWNRIRRWCTTTWFRDQIVVRRLNTWEAADAARDEVGRFCLINEMQVVVHNGWAHV